MRRLVLSCPLPAGRCTGNFWRGEGTASWGPEIPAARLGQRSQSQLSEIEKGAATLTSPHCLLSPSLPSAGCPQALPRSPDAPTLQSLSAPLAQPEKLPNHTGRRPASPHAPKVLRVSTPLSHSSLLSGGFSKEALEESLLGLLSLRRWDNGFQGQGLGLGSLSALGSVLAQPLPAR